MLFYDLHRLRNLLRGHRVQPGQAMAEMAMVIGLFLLIVFGAINLLGFGNTQSIVTRAADNGVHEAAITGGDQARVRAVVDSVLTGAGLNPNLATVTVSCPDGCGRYKLVQVTVSYQAQGLAGGAFGLPTKKVIGRSYVRASEVDVSGGKGPVEIPGPGPGPVPSLVGGPESIPGAPPAP